MPELQPYRPARAAAEDQSIRGRRDVVEAELQRIERAGQLVSKAEPVDEGRGTVSVRIRRIVDLEHAAPARQGRHPGWTIGVLLAASALVVSCAWAVAIVMTAIAAMATLILGLLLVAGGVIVLAKAHGGDTFSQTMNVRKR